MIQRFVKEEEGQTLVEYGLLISLIALVVIAALSYLAWRGYQQPDLILDFANVRYC